MKKLTCLLLLFFSALPLMAKETQASHKNEANIYVVMGQSNAAGWSRTRGETSKIIEDFYGAEGLENIRMFNTSKGMWAKHYYINKTNDLTGLIGGGRSVDPYWAMKMNKESPADTIYFIKHAVGGVSIGAGGGHWDIKDENTGDQKGKSLWNDFEKKAFEPAIAELKKESLTPKIRAIFWMQGETNANGPAGRGINNTMTEKEYFSYLQTLVKKIKKLEGFDKNTVILLGTISIRNTDGSPAKTPGKTPRYNPTVRKAQEKLAKSNRQVKLVVNDDAVVTGTGNDGIHFNDDDFNAMAEKMVKLLSKNKK